MKYIKKFEMINSEGQIIVPNYKIGDYLQVHSDKDRIEDGIVVVEDITKYWYICRYVFQNSFGVIGYVEWIYEYEVVRKLEAYEIEAMKYNI